MVETEELVRFLRRGKTSEADIRLRFGTCPRKLLKELVAIELIHKTTDPLRYYATPINKNIKAKIKLREEDLKKTPVSVRVNGEEAKIVFAKGGIVEPKNAIIHGGTTIPPGIEVERKKIQISVQEAFTGKPINSKSIEKAMERVWGTPKSKKDGWFKRLLKRNAKH